jgi:hypothetical protein
MNIPEDWIGSFGYEYLFSNSKTVMERHFAPCEILLCTDTKQMDDYSKYEMDYFDPATKDKRHAAVFPSELQKAFDLGKKLLSE